MAEQLGIAAPADEYDLPKSIVQRLVKEAMPEGTIVNKDAKIALAKSATVFVLFLTSIANEMAAKANRKTINGNDILAALQEVELAQFVDPLRAELEAFKAGLKEKRALAEKRKGADPSGTTSVSASADDDHDHDGDDDDEDIEHMDTSSGAGTKTAAGTGDDDDDDDENGDGDADGGESRPEDVQEDEMHE